MTIIFDQKSYKELLKARLLHRKEQIGRAVNFQAMANACRVQKTYLSRVLNEKEGKAHLSSDQLFRSAQYLQLSLEERRYLFTLFDWEKSQISERKDELQKQLEDLRKTAKKTENVLDANKTVVRAESIHEYYLDPFLQLVHMFCHLRRYRDSPTAIARKLGLTRMRLSNILKKLARVGVIQLSADGAIKVLHKQMHLSADSSYYHPYRALLRLRTIDLLQRKSSDSSYSFSVIFATSKNTRKEIHSSFLEFLKAAEKKVAQDKSAEKEVYQMNFDLLDWSE